MSYGIVQLKLKQKLGNMEKIIKVSFYENHTASI